MGRIFYLLTAVAVLMILVVGGGVNRVSKARMAQARQDSATAVANAVALTLSQQINLLNRTLNKMAQDPEVLVAVTRADPVLLATVAEKLERHFPDAQKIRLLLPGVSEPDEKNVPCMGFADLDMVRETFTGHHQPPRVQGYKGGGDRHLAITGRIMHNGQVAGVILACLNYDFLGKSVQAAAVKYGYLELRQAKLALGASGERQFDTDTGRTQSVQTKVAGTDWEIYYNYADSADLSEMVFIVGIIVVSALLAMLAFFVGYRRLSGLITQDLGSVLNACKDIITRRPPGSYPISLTEITGAIPALMQFKQIMDYNEGPAKYDSLDELLKYDVDESFVQEDKFWANLAEESIDKPGTVELPVGLKKVR